MFEEISVWMKIDSQSAIRYLGFRNLASNEVWIAFGNLVWMETERDLSADDLIAADGTLEAFLKDLPTEPEHWRPTVADAIDYFVTNNPRD